MQTHPSRLQTSSRIQESSPGVKTRKLFSEAPYFMKSPEINVLK